MLTNGEWGGILTKLSARAAAETRRTEKNKTSRKKFLTKRARCGILNKSSAKTANDKRFQKCEECRKKFLTNETACGKIPTVPRVRGVYLVN